MTQPKRLHGNPIPVVEFNHGSKAILTAMMSG
jgi:hypothetical protein